VLIPTPTQRNASALAGYPRWIAASLALVALWIVPPSLVYPRTVTMDTPPTIVDRYAIFEAVLHVTDLVAKNPFTEVTLTGDFTPDEGETVSVRGFCDSSKGSDFRVRFCPQQAGDYSFTITYQDSAGSEQFTGQFTSVEAGRKGFIRVDPEYPNHFLFENGGHPFICSKTAWVIGDSQNWQGFLDKMLLRKENCIRFGVETNYYHETIGKDVWPWGGTRSSPSFSRFSPTVWQKLESIIAYAAERGVFSEPVIFCTLRRDDPASPDPQMELYWDYLLARLSAFTSIVTWQLYNEYASAKSYQAYMADYIRNHDPYKHLICSSAGTTNDALWPLEPWMDIAINHSCTDDSQLNSRYHAIATTIHGYRKPAWCDETGRENRHGNNSGVHRRKQYWTWNVCGDYWSYHSWEGCEGIEDLAYNGPGSEYLRFIRPFWEQTGWWKMQPADERILNDPASQYEWCLASDKETVVYMVNEAEGASTAEGKIELAVGIGPFEALFYSPAEGSYFGRYKRGGYHPGGTLSLTHPAFVDDLVIYVKHARGPSSGEQVVLELTWAVADTYADKRTPDANYGGDPDLRVGSGDAERITYVRFNVSSSAVEVVSATLTLACMNGSVEGGGSAYSVSGDWEENTLTWNNRPPVSGKPLDSLGPVSIGSTYDLDVTGAFTGESVLCVALVSEFQDGAGYSSREGGSRPQLTFRYRRSKPEIFAAVPGTTASGFTISWPGQGHQEYSIEYSPDLFRWLEASTLPDFSLPFYEDGVWSWLDPSWLTPRSRFYRVAW
jgi:hypothetical protein